MWEYPLKMMKIPKIISSIIFFFRILRFNDYWRYNSI